MTNYTQKIDEMLLVHIKEGRSIWGLQLLVSEGVYSELEHISAHAQGQFYGDGILIYKGIEVLQSHWIRYDDMYLGQLGYNTTGGDYA